MVKTKKEEILLKMTKLDFGNVIFTIGILIILIAGIINFEKSIQQIIFATLIIFGITIGLVNITKKETKTFLISSGIIILSMAPFVTIGINPNVGQVYSVSIFAYLTQALIQNQTLYQIIMNIANFFLALIVPASVIVAIKAIYKTAKDK